VNADTPNSDAGNGDRMSQAVAREATRRQRLLRLYLALLAVPAATVGAILFGPVVVSEHPDVARIEVGITELRRHVETNRNNIDRLSGVSAPAEFAKLQTTVSELQRDLDENRNSVARLSDQVSTVAAMLRSSGERRPLSTEVLLSEAYSFDGAQIEIPDELAKLIDTIVQQVKGGAGDDVNFEIESQIGPDIPAAERSRIAGGRLNAVRRYLYQMHDIPLQRIQVIALDGAPKQNAIFIRVRG
jgi:hypothetical protein